MKHHNKTGFTLVELTIAMVFISVLFLAIGFTTSGVISAYKKGLSIKSVNSLAHDLIEDFTTSVQEAPAIDYESLCGKYYNPKDDSTNKFAYEPDGDINAAYTQCVNDKAYRLLYRQWYTDISVNGNKMEESAPVFGTFCTGKYSYVWNTGYTFAGNNSNYQAIEDDTSDPLPVPFISGYYDSNTENHFRLAKFTDPNFSICATFHKALPNEYIKPSTDLSKLQIPITEGVELISSPTNPLAIYDFTAFRPAQNDHTKRLFYPASMILATIAGGINIKAAGDYCTPPAGLELQTDFSYCAINQFNFTMRATGD